MPTLKITISLQLDEQDYTHSNCSALVLKTEKFLQKEFPVLLLSTDWNEFPLPDKEIYSKEERSVLSYVADAIAMATPLYPDWHYQKDFCHCNGIQWIPGASFNQNYHYILHNGRTPGFYPRSCPDCKKYWCIDCGSCY